MHMIKYNTKQYDTIKCVRMIHNINTRMIRVRLEHQQIKVDELTVNSSTYARGQHSCVSLLLSRRRYFYTGRAIR